MDRSTPELGCLPLLPKDNSSSALCSDVAVRGTIPKESSSAERTLDYWLIGVKMARNRISAKGACPVGSDPSMGWAPQPSFLIRSCPTMGAHSPLHARSGHLSRASARPCGL